MNHRTLFVMFLCVLLGLLYALPQRRLPGIWLYNQAAMVWAGCWIGYSLATAAGSRLKKAKAGMLLCGVLVLWSFAHNPDLSYRACCEPWFPVAAMVKVLAGGWMAMVPVEVIKQTRRAGLYGALAGAALGLLAAPWVGPPLAQQLFLVALAALSFGLAGWLHAASHRVFIADRQAQDGII
ncbi:MAG TPA: hypothetical protein VFS21_25650 [Roseiflexaceae bacterium]|nr:hypothetical protein [Roseiflexaceae bacterium]